MNIWKKNDRKTNQGTKKRPGPIYQSITDLEDTPWTLVKFLSKKRNFTFIFFRHRTNSNIFGVLWQKFEPLSGQHLNSIGIWTINQSLCCQWMPQKVFPSFGTTFHSLMQGVQKSAEIYLSSTMAILATSKFSPLGSTFLSSLVCPQKAALMGFYFFHIFEKLLIKL